MDTIIIILFVILFMVVYKYYNKQENINTDYINTDYIEILNRGNNEFQKKFGNNNYRGYIENQTPHTAILCCSDSRVPIERIFDLPKGEIFVVREAGHVPFDNSIASLEYAIKVLKVKNLLVLGHTECGAVKAVMENNDLGSRALNKLADSIRKDLKHNNTLDENIKNHAKSVLNNVINSSNIINDAVKNNKLRTEYGIYDIKTGKVTLYL